MYTNIYISSRTQAQCSIRPAIDRNDLTGHETGGIRQGVENRIRNVGGIGHSPQRDPRGQRGRELLQFFRVPTIAGGASRQRCVRHAGSDRIHSQRRPFFGPRACHAQHSVLGRAIRAQSRDAAQRRATGDVHDHARPDGPLTARKKARSRSLFLGTSRHPPDRFGAHIPRARDVDGHDAGEEFVVGHFAFDGTDARTVDQAVEVARDRIDEFLAPCPRCDVAVAVIVQVRLSLEFRWWCLENVGHVDGGTRVEQSLRRRESNSRASALEYLFRSCWSNGFQSSESKHTVMAIVRPENEYVLAILSTLIRDRGQWRPSQIEMHLLFSFSRPCPISRI